MEQAFLRAARLREQAAVCDKQNGRAGLPVQSPVGARRLELRRAERLAPARIPHGHDARQLIQCTAQVLVEFLEIARGKDRHAGDGVEKCGIKHALMRFAVFADDAGAVDRKHDLDALQRRVVDDLVVAALQKKSNRRRKPGASRGRRGRPQT